MTPQQRRWTVYRCPLHPERLQTNPNDWCCAVVTCSSAVERITVAQVANDDDVFAVIDRREYEEAKRDPRLKAFAEAGVRHLKKLRQEGRIR